MKKIQFDQNGIFASTPELSAIALQVLEQEKRERELRREWFSKWNESQPADGGQWGIGTSATATDAVLRLYCSHTKQSNK